MNLYIKYILSISVLIILFDAQIVPTLATGSPFWPPPMSFWYKSINLRKLPFLLVRSYLKFTLNLPCPRPRTSHFSWDVGGCTEVHNWMAQLCLRWGNVIWACQLFFLSWAPTYTLCSQIFSQQFSLKIQPSSVFGHLVGLQLIKFQNLSSFLLCQRWFHTSSAASLALGFSLSS